MREKLRAIEGVRATFQATFERYGVKTSYGHEKRTLLFRDVTDARGVVVADHLWFTLSKAFERLDLVAGQRVAFDARVKSYEKGYRGRRWEAAIDNPPSIDYKLNYPTRVRLLDAAEAATEE